MGGAQVLLKNFDVLGHVRLNFLWPLLLEMCVSVTWSYLMLLLTVLWLVGLVLPHGTLPALQSPFIPQGSGLILGATCLVQFALSEWLDRRYERGVGRYFYWMIWYPIVFWLINICSIIVAYPKVLSRSGGKRARWVSPDRGIRPKSGN